VLSLTADKRIIKSGWEFEKLFHGSPIYRDPIIKRDGTVEDSIKLISKVPAKYQGDTASQYQSQVKVGTSQVSLKSTTVVQMPGDTKTTTPPLITNPPPTTTTPPPATTIGVKLKNLLTIPNTWLSSLNLNMASLGTLAAQLVLVGISVDLMVKAFPDEDTKQIENTNTNPKVICHNGQQRAIARKCILSKRTWMLRLLNG